MSRLQDFQHHWLEFDDGSGSILPEQLEVLLTRLNPPLGLGRLASGKDVLRFVYDLNIPLIHGRVPFHRTMYELVRRSCETAIPEVGGHHHKRCMGFVHAWVRRTPSAADFLS